MTRLAGIAPCLLAGLLWASSVAAGQGWEGGVKAGISHASMTASQEFTWGSAPASAAFVQRVLAGPLSVQAEVAHLRRTGVSIVGGSRLTMTADYVELPVLLALRLGSAFGIAPFLSAGPSVAIKLRCRLQFSGGGVRTDDDCDGARGARSNRVDVGVAGGGGIGWTVGAVTFIVESRVTAGLRPYVLPTDVQNARSFSWSVLGGIALPLSKLRSAPPAMPAGRRPLFATSPSPPVSIPVAVPIATASTLPASRRRITVYADNVDVGEVLMGIAKATGLNVLVSSQIRTRVTATLVDVPAEEAVRAIVATAGLSLLAPDAPGRATIVFRRPAASANSSLAGLTPNGHF